MAPAASEAPKPGNLGVLDGVLVLVDDHLAFLAVVDPALAEGDAELLRAVAEERVVAPELADAQLLLAVVGPALEAEGLQVELRLRDPVVAHHLLEAIVVARVDEAVRRGASRRAGLGDDLGVGAGQRARPVEIGQRDAPVGGAQERVGREEVRVLVVGQRLVPERLIAPKLAWGSALVAGSPGSPGAPSAGLPAAI
jgi:hypothetical protein